LPSKNDEVAKDESKVIDPVKKSKTPAKSAEAPKLKKTEKVEKVEKPSPKTEQAEKTEKVSELVESTEEKPSTVIPPVKAHDVRGIAVKVAAVGVGLVAVVVLVFGILIYAYHSENPAVKSVASVVPYPVERVNGHFVTYNAYVFEVEANKRAYQNNAKLNNQPAVNFNSADGKKLVVQIKQHALDKLVDDSLTAQLASKKKVKVTDKEVNDLIGQLYQRYGGKDQLLKTLKEIYGWNVNDLKGVVYKQLLAKNLEDKVTSDPAVTAAAKTKAQNVLKDIKAGGDFTEAAKKSSQDGRRGTATGPGIRSYQGSVRLRDPESGREER